MELLKELCECSGIPGQEARLREIVRREMDPVADEVRVDALGNLIVLKRVTKRRSPKKLMVAAHMDEIGFVVSNIDERGLLRLVPLGGHDPRNMVAQRVTVCGTRRDLTGLLYPGIKPPHIQTDADRGKSLQVSDFVVDLYMPASRVKREVEVGAMVTLSVPTRYVHTSIELADRGDIEAAVNLLTAFIEEGQKADLTIV